jgi:hypothetical protein
MPVRHHGGVAEASAALATMTSVAVAETAAAEAAVAAAERQAEGQAAGLRLLLSLARPAEPVVASAPAAGRSGVRGGRR